MSDGSAQSLAAFVEAIAADRPSPGCGAAAGATLAMAAACAAKAFRISARHCGGDAHLALAATRAEAIARTALREADHDARDFEVLIQAPAAEPGSERALRTDGEELLSLAVELGGLMEMHRRAVDVRMQGDIVAAALLARAAEQVAQHNLAELG